MGQNFDRLVRLRANRESDLAVGVRMGQEKLQVEARAAASDASAGVRKAVLTEGYEGEYGETVTINLTDIRERLNKFVDYQTAVSNAIALAHQALQDTANSTGGLPEAALTPDQQATIAIHTTTNSPVHVQPGVTMTPAQAEQYYLDQAAAAQEEQAAKLAAALDLRLQEIIDGMPTTDYDEPKPKPDPSDDDETGGGGQVDNPGVTGGGGAGGTGGGGGGGGLTIGRPQDPHLFVDPPRDPDVPDHSVYEPPHIDDPRYPDPDGDGTDDPNVDGNVDGEVPGVRPGGTGGVPGGGGGGAGTVGGGLGGLVGGAGLAGGAALARRLNGGAGLIAGGVGGVGVGGAGGAGGVGGAGASGVVAQPGGANGGRGGMVGGAAAGGGAAGGRGKRNRRRGQDLMAFEVEPDDDETLPDIGSAGAAGRSTSEGREELGW